MTVYLVIPSCTDIQMVDISMVQYPLMAVELCIIRHTEG